MPKRKPHQDSLRRLRSSSNILLRNSLLLLRRRLPHHLRNLASLGSRTMFPSLRQRHDSLPQTIPGTRILLPATILIVIIIVVIHGIRVALLDLRGRATEFTNDFAGPARVGFAFGFCAFAHMFVFLLAREGVIAPGDEDGEGHGDGDAEVEEGPFGGYGALGFGVEVPD